MKYNIDFDKLNSKIIIFFMSFLFSIILLSTIFIFYKNLEYKNNIKINKQSNIFKNENNNNIEIDFDIYENEINIPIIIEDKKENIIDNKIIEIESSIEKPNTYFDKNIDILNLFKINKLILEKNIFDLNTFDNNEVIQNIKTNNSNYISIKHIINIEKLFLLNVKQNELKSFCLTTNNGVSNIIQNINKDKNISQEKKESLLIYYYDVFDFKTNNYVNKLLTKYNKDDGVDDLLFIQDSINSIKYIK